MIEPPSRRLIAAASRYNFAKSTFGVALADISHIPLDDGLKEDILACLSNAEWAENVWGLFFCHGFIAGGRALELGTEIARMLIEETPKWIGHVEAKLRLQALPLFISYRSSIAGFENRMSALLTDQDSEIRALALQNADTFISSSDLEKLFPFQADACVMEDPTGNRRVYILRNMALQAVERILDRRFVSGERSEIVDGNLTFWRDWNPFLQWWAAPWRRWRNALTPRHN